MQQLSSASAATNQQRDPDRVDGQRQWRNKMSKLEEQPAPLRSPGNSLDGCEQQDCDSEDFVLSSDEDDEIILSTTTNKFDLKRRFDCRVARSEQQRQQRPLNKVSSVEQTKCDDDGDTNEEASETGPAKAKIGEFTTQDMLLTSQIVATTTTTLSPSPSPTPQPFQSSPSLSQALAAIDSTTNIATNNTTTSIVSQSPILDHHTDRRNSRSKQQHQHSVVTKLNKQQLEHLDSLIVAIKQGNFSEFCQLVDKKQQEFKPCLLNIFVDGNTALHYSLMYRRSLKWCKQLISNGANPNLANRNGWHPIHLAAYSCSNDTLNYITDCVCNAEQLA